jgi:L-ascorbate metabolism protein UlaG (beta-lactamase superfamily)
MELDWFGRDCVRITTARGTVVVNPYESGGKPIPAVRADVAVLSARGAAPPPGSVLGEPVIVTGPGEYEVGGLFIVGVDAPNRGRSIPPSTMYCLLAESINVCVPGPLQAVPSQADMERLGAIDVLLWPVAADSLPAAGAAEVVALAEPSLIVPLDTGEPPDPERMRRFLQEIGADEAEPVPTLRVLPNRLPDAPEIRLIARAPASS